MLMIHLVKLYLQASKKNYDILPGKLWRILKKEQKSLFGNPMTLLQMRKLVLFIEPSGDMETVPF
ncbi:hypothetical protein AD941_02935 [Gluconobacter albidus]|uniref:Transposase n=1 Tax=Gluconobacter albidus TaxID=318683 RepID=A0AAW3R0C1_9PROT|nr:hypothetical protein AD941_02935 [Gluconobacter albidus]